MNTPRYVSGLKIGTTNSCCIIAELDEQDQPVIIGVGLTRSEGMNRGMVINAEKAIESIESCVDDAEIMSEVQITSAFAGIAGDSIRSIRSNGIIIAGKSAGREKTPVFTRNDVERVMRAAETINLPMDREVLHIIPYEYKIDGQGGIKNPVGMVGVRLEADVQIITGAVVSAQNIYRCVKKAGISVCDLVLEPLASSYAVLTEEEKELGVGLIDMGGGSTDVMVFHEGAIKHTSVLGVGGDILTKDIMVVLRTSYEEAEELKIRHGHCFLPALEYDEEIGIGGLSGRKTKIIKRSHLAEIIQSRLAEIFTNIANQLNNADLGRALRGGIVLTGGAVQIEGIVELAEEIFRLPVKIGYPRGFQGEMDIVHNPSFATALGLIKYGISRGDTPGMIRGDDSKVFQKIFGRMREWFEDFF